MIIIYQIDDILFEDRVMMRFLCRPAAVDRSLLNSSRQIPGEMTVHVTAIAAVFSVCLYVRWASINAIEPKS
jgi:hypothetical protein